MAVVSPRAASLWWDQLADDEPGELVARPPLDGDATADVVVVGAGLTGLWTAYYLHETDPSLEVLVVEQEVAGFGASGRDRGWCSARFPRSGRAIADRYGDEAAAQMRAAMRDAVVEVGGVARAEGIECDFAFGGTVTLARNAAQLERLRATVADAQRWDDEDVLLDAEAVAEHVRAAGVVGGAYTPDCARVQPARLTRGLARVAESRGVRIVERTRALRLSPRAVVTDRGTVRARFVVRATASWTPRLPTRLPGSRREVVPVRSPMIATAPLPPGAWARIGLDRGQTFGDGAHLPVHGVRTADDRLVLGGRGVRYQSWATIGAPSEPDGRAHGRLHRALVDLFPAAGEVAVTHRWSRPLDVPRDGWASVGLDPATGIGWAGGYGDDGVATSNLAGRTLADLVTDADTPLVRLPWVGHRSPAWQPEPVRRGAIAAATGLAAIADVEERLTARPSRVAAAVAPLLGD